MSFRLLPGSSLFYVKRRHSVRNINIWSHLWKFSLSVKERSPSALFFTFVFMCVHVYVCTYMHVQVCTYVYAHGKQRINLGVIILYYCIPRAGITSLCHMVLLLFKGSEGANAYTCACKANSFTESSPQPKVSLLMEYVIFVAYEHLYSFNYQKI